MVEAHPPYSLFPVVSCGPDWLTCTSKKTGVSNALEDWAMHKLYEEKACEGQVSQARRLGFSGWASPGLFVGQRPGDVMVQLTGARCSPLAMDAINLSSNVSRLDLQVTVWTEGEQPRLAEWTYKRLLERDAVTRLPFRMGLILGHPSGATLTLGQRVSTSYARLYDKTAEIGSGVPRLLWRYEVEWKGKPARRLAMRLSAQRCSPTLVCTLVHGWYTKRGVLPAFTSEGSMAAPGLSIDAPERCVLDWFRSSVSITIAKAINKHGRQVTLQALGLLGPDQ